MGAKRDVVCFPGGVEGGRVGAGDFQVKYKGSIGLMVVSLLISFWVFLGFFFRAFFRAFSS